MNEEDPKEVARIERQRPETERMLRQFLNTDGPKGATDKYLENYDMSFRKDETPAHECDECHFKAFTIDELEAHERSDHTHCRHCGNAFTREGRFSRAGIHTHKPPDCWQSPDRELLWLQQICLMCAGLD